MADAHIHGGGMELRNSGDGLQNAVPRTSSSGVKFDGGQLEGATW